MKIFRHAGRVLSAFFAPIRCNAAFFIFMYILGLVCTYSVVPDKKGYHAYSLAWDELFLDLYILCLFLIVLPCIVRQWVRRLFYFIAYGIALIDVYCYVEFGSTITPTMLLLVGETNTDEATEFLSSYVGFDVVFSKVGWVVLTGMVHVACTYVVSRIYYRRRRLVRRHPWMIAALKMARAAVPWMGAVTLALLIYTASECVENKRAVVRLMSCKNIGSVEHELTRKDKAVLYLPLYRLVFSVYANSLTAQQVDKLIGAIDTVRVDSCSFRSDNIVLIIGESYNRHHAQLYGYDKPTTPRQKARARRGDLVPFSDVVTPWNLTSFVFKHLFSLYTVGDKGEWCDYPLFPELFRKAGYHVTFVTNQFLPQAKEAVYDFSGGFFLNNPELSSAQFDTRNTQLFRYDGGLLNDYDHLRPEGKDHNLIIFHLKGQHVDYQTRYPKDRTKWGVNDYDRPRLNPRERHILASYDNAVLYNDSVVDAVIRKFEAEDAIVIYVPDHGEECYGDDIHFYGRMHSTEITARLAREEFDIPFWIWCSKKYRKAHPDVFARIKAARDKRYMTDAMAHMLLWLGGIHCPEYRDDLNILSTDYNENRPRILKNQVDYDKLDVRGDASATNPNNKKR